MSNNQTESWQNCHLFTLSLHTFHVLFVMWILINGLAAGENEWTRYGMISAALVVSDILLNCVALNGIKYQITILILAYPLEQIFKVIFLLFYQEAYILSDTIQVSCIIYIVASVILAAAFSVLLHQNREAGWPAEQPRPPPPPPPPARPPTLRVHLPPPSPQPSPPPNYETAVNLNTV